MEKQGINDNQMTVAAGLSVGLLGKLKKNGKGMSSVNIEKILSSYPNLSAEWLLTGRGEMLKGEPQCGPSSAGVPSGGAEWPAAASYGVPTEPTDRVAECDPSDESPAPDTHVGSTPDKSVTGRSSSVTGSARLMDGAATPVAGSASSSGASAHLAGLASTSTAAGSSPLGGAALPMGDHAMATYAVSGAPWSAPAARRDGARGEGIPLIPAESMAAAPAGDLSATATSTADRYVIPLFQDADFLIPVKGSSMHPHYSSGDIVACRRIPLTGLFFQWGKVYVIDTAQGVLVKRVKPGTDPHHILIVSDSPSYDPFELPISTLRAVALVVGVIRLE